MAWQNSNIPTWLKAFVGAFWNALLYNWDDINLTWDAISKDDWQEADKPTWQEANRPAWQEANKPTWQTPN